MPMIFFEEVGETHPSTFASVCEPATGATTNIAGWNIPIFNREYIFKKYIFYCHASLPEGRQCWKDHVSGMISDGTRCAKWQFATSNKTS